MDGDPVHGPAANQRAGHIEIGHFFNTFWLTRLILAGRIRSTTEAAHDVGISSGFSVQVRPMLDQSQYTIADSFRSAQKRPITARVDARSTVCQRRCRPAHTRWSATSSGIWATP